MTEVSRQLSALFPSNEAWRHVLLSAAVLGSLAFMLSLDPITQSTGYHGFADQRTVLGVPNFFDVSSNLAFLLVGLAGVVLCFADRTLSLRIAWLTFFAGVATVSAGSAYYHANPNNGTLVWDRLPLIVGLMGLWAAILGEYASERLGKVLLLPAVLSGFFSVLYWHWSGDLRFYVWIQAVSLLTIPAVMVLFRSRYTRQWALLGALALYGLAKISEGYDREVFALTRQLLSGHTLKHLLAASSCLVVLLMLAWRRSAGDRGPG